MLRENHKITSRNKNHATIKLNDIVLIEKERKPRSAWIWKPRSAKSNSLITRPICKLYHIESLREGSDKIVTVNDNTIKQRPKMKQPFWAIYSESLQTDEQFWWGECVNSS